MPLVQRLTDLAFLDVCLEPFVSLSTRCTEKLGTLAITGKELLNPNVVATAPGDLFEKAKLALCGCFLIWQILKDALAEEPARKTTTHNNYKYQ